MPKAKLPTNPKGWAVATATALVGLISSFAFLRFLERMGWVK